MSAEVVQATITIEPITCGSCGVWFGVESSMLRSRRQDGGSFWCPKGCEIRFGDFENARLKRELEAKERVLQAERQDNARVRNLRDHYERSARTYRGHLTRIRKRVGNGVCPCCHRTFKQLAAHMKSQHPAYAKPVERAK